jgi:hypothetical protein
MELVPFTQPLSITEIPHREGYNLGEGRCQPGLKKGRARQVRVTYHHPRLQFWSLSTPLGKKLAISL